MKKIGLIPVMVLLVLLPCCKQHSTDPSFALLDSINLKRGQIISCGPLDKQFGSADFQTSCNGEVKDDFNLAIKLLHSFEYDEADKAFAKLIDKQPDCAMAYWGIAMSNFHPLWTPPTEAELIKGAVATDIAVSLASTKREKDYISAIAAFYKDWKNTDHRTRCLAFEKGMEKVFANYGNDKDAAVFYALALNAAADPLDKTFTHECCLVVPAGGSLHALGHIGRGARRDAVHHGVGTRCVLLYPLFEWRIAQRLDELQQPAARAVAVVAQVVAVHQRHSARTGCPARAQDADQTAVDRVACLACLHGRQVSAQVGKRGPVQLVLGIQVVTRLGHREADDAGGGVGTHGNQRGQVILVGDHPVDRLDDGVVALALGGDGFERVTPILRLQRRDGVGHVRAEVAACDGPARVALLAQCVNVNGLVGAVERAQAQVQDEIHGA